MRKEDRLKQLEMQHRMNVQAPQFQQQPMYYPMYPQAVMPPNMQNMRYMPMMPNYAGGAQQRYGQPQAFSKSLSISKHP